MDAPRVEPLTKEQYKKLVDRYQQLRSENQRQSKKRNKRERARKAEAGGRAPASSSRGRRRSSSTSSSSSVSSSSSSVTSSLSMGSIDELDDDIDFDSSSSRSITSGASTDTSSFSSDVFEDCSSSASSAGGRGRHHHHHSSKNQKALVRRFFEAKERRGERFGDSDDYVMESDVENDSDVEYDGVGDRFRFGKKHRRDVDGGSGNGSGGPRTSQKLAKAAMADYARLRRKAQKRSEKNGGGGDDVGGVCRCGGSTPNKPLRAMLGLPTDTPPALGDSVLVLIDCQNTYTEGPMKLHGVEPAIAHAKALLERARALKVPVIHVVHDAGAGSLYDVKGHSGAIVEALKPAAGEPTVTKNFPNSFEKTNLNDLISKKITTSSSSKKAKNLVLVGFMTHCCVNSTARAAFNLGYTTTVVAKATATRCLPDPVTGKPVPAAELQRAALTTLSELHAVIVKSHKEIPDGAVAATAAASATATAAATTTTAPNSTS